MTDEARIMISESQPIPDLMAQFLDDEWLAEAIRREDEADCNIGAGYAGGHFAQFITNPQAFRAVKRLQAIVLQQFHELLETYDLGIGTEAAFVCGKPLVLERLQNPSVETQQRLLAILEASVVIEGKSLPESLSSDIQHILRNVLSYEDWNTIATVAGDAVRNRMLTQFQAA